MLFETLRFVNQHISGFFKGVAGKDLASEKSNRDASAPIVIY